ncbi:MAG: DUF1801 domain-containing protein [Planctomycetota bacterium]|nr:DUF1801 domain-containing protein [Planctomycetota bacterium]
MAVTTVDEYLETLDPGRRAAMEGVREVILAHLPEGYEEGIQYGMIGYFVPHSICPDGYHCDSKQPVPFVGLGNGKAKMSLHMFCLYVDPPAVERFAAAWKATGRKLDMGKSCVRFTKLADVALDVVGEAIAAAPVNRFLDVYEGALPEKIMKKRGRYRMG